MNAHQNFPHQLWEPKIIKSNRISHSNQFGFLENIENLPKTNWSRRFCYVAGLKLCESHNKHHFLDTIVAITIVLKIFTLVLHQLEGMQTQREDENERDRVKEKRS